MFAGRRTPDAATAAAPAGRKGAGPALRWAARHPVARFAVVLIVAGHAVMVGIMSMTPVHLGHHGHGLRAVGLVISLHILGMYALSPLVGWLADRVGAMRTALLGLLLLGGSALVILRAPDGLVPITVALAWSPGGLIVPAAAAGWYARSHHDPALAARDQR